MRMTYAIAYSLGLNAGDRQMRQAGRTVWNKDDAGFAARTLTHHLSPDIKAPQSSADLCLRETSEKQNSSMHRFAGTEPAKLPSSRDQDTIARPPEMTAQTHSSLTERQVSAQLHTMNSSDFELLLLDLSGDDRKATLLATDTEGVLRRLPWLRAQNSIGRIGVHIRVSARKSILLRLPPRVTLRGKPRIAIPSHHTMCIACHRATSMHANSSLR